MKKLIVILSLLIFSACSRQTPSSNQPSNSTETTVNSSESTIEKTTTPTLFIHGFSGNEGSFHSLIQRMESSNYARKEMTITVNADGSIQTSDQLSGSPNNPMIQVLFADNESHEWNQAEWIYNVLVYLKETQGVEAVNLVGHSMGGVSAFRFLGTFPNDNLLPRINKFIAIGAPFNDFIEMPTPQTTDEIITNGPNTFSNRLADFSTMAPMISDVHMLLIAGQISSDDLSDGIVSVESALGIYHLMEEQGIDISYALITENAQHSQLHENTEVDQLLEQFLWQ